MRHEADMAAPLLDADMMGGWFQHSLPGYEHVQVRSCRIHQTRRRISRKTEQQGAPFLGVVYTLELCDRDTDTVMTQWLYAKAYTLGASAAALREASAAAQTRPQVGLPLVRIEPLDMLVWALPNDPALPHLPQFLDATLVHTLLGCAGSLHKQEPDSPLPKAQIFRYEPEEHCTAYFEFGAMNGEPIACYGKTYVNGQWLAAARRIEVLRWRSQSDPGSFVIAQPLGSSDALHAVWQVAVQGQPLRDCLRGLRGEIWIARLARALARLHAAPSQAEDLLSPQMLLERTQKQRAKLVRADARLAQALDLALHHLQCNPPVVTPRVTIHGDFHVDQMLCAGERVVLFDFDNFATGSPAHDVADFVSQWLTDASFRPERDAALVRGFVAHYLACAPQPPSRSELDWYLRLLCLRKAYSFFVRHRAGWRERVLHAAALAARGGLDPMLPPAALALETDP